MMQAREAAGELIVAHEIREAQPADGVRGCQQAELQRVGRFCPGSIRNRRPRSAPPTRNLYSSGQVGGEQWRAWGRF
jgi:hypothetical protein